jgi:hypothetical protein
MGGGRVEKWSKQCMHMWINEKKFAFLETMEKKYPSVELALEINSSISLAMLIFPFVQGWCTVIKYVRPYLCEFDYRN